MSNEAFLMTGARKIALIAAFVFLTAMAGYSPADSDGKAPDFAIKDLQGKTVTMASMRGKVFLLNFWATWCPPCVAEMPSLKKLRGQLKSKGLEVVGISVDRSVDDVKAYARKHGLDFTILVDDSGAVARRFHVFSTPTTFLIDRNGNIVEKFFGEYDWTDPEVKAKIEKLL